MTINSSEQPSRKVDIHNSYRNVVIPRFNRNQLVISGLMKTTTALRFEWEQIIGAQMENRINGGAKKGWNREIKRERGYILGGRGWFFGPVWKVRLRFGGRKVKAAKLGFIDWGGSVFSGPLNAKALRSWVRSLREVIGGTLTGAIIRPLYGYNSLARGSK